MTKGEAFENGQPQQLLPDVVTGPAITIGADGLVQVKIGVADRLMREMGFVDDGS